MSASTPSQTQKNEPMAATSGLNEAALRDHSRWSVPQAWAAGLIVYGVMIALASPTAVIWINDIAWALAALIACLLCVRTARAVELNGRRAWWLMTAGCASWFVGQLHWNFNQLVLGVPLPYPNLGQIFFSSFPALVIAGVLNLPEARRGAPLTSKHIGNIGLVLCCLLATVALGLMEPVLATQESRAFVLVGAVHSLLLAACFLVALYALWTYRWKRSWTAILLIVVACGIYSVSNLVYAHALLTESYVESDLINASWCAVFGCLAWAAHERWWLEQHPAVEVPRHVLARERWLEAVIPALLITIIAAVAVLTAPNSTPRALGIAGAIFILFALILAMRETWIQAESQRLNDELIQANWRLALANEDLQASERRYRDLNAQLEARVAQRTTELGRAYGELEGFAYAVAHDLKAPLRSINSFAQLLREHLSEDASPDIEQHLDRIRKGSLRMAELIDDLLAYSHIERRNLLASTVELQAVVRSVVAQFADELRQRQLTIHVDVEAVQLHIDADGLRLVLRNLIENAIKYSRDASAPDVKITAKTEDGVVLLAVADNGVGFDMAHHDQIFRIFHRLHRDERYPGTGIGLAIVRKAVERMHGRVWARSEPTKGATFFVELPLQKLTADR